MCTADAYAALFAGDGPKVEIRVWGGGDMGLSYPPELGNHQQNGGETSGIWGLDSQ